MDRMTIYSQEQGRSVDILFGARAAMIGLGKLAQAAFGSNTVVRGLAVTPNSPAALNVLVGIGEIYSLLQVDATPWGSLTADTDLIIQQGLNMAVQTIATPAPVTGGFSINYLIEAQFQPQDTNPAVLPFYNSANPSIPLNGQGGSGAAQATERQGVCVVQAKAGIAAASGTQTTPAVDSGWTALAVVTVAFGATTVTSGSISVAAGVPQVSSILQMLQTESTNYALDTSTTPNQITIALTPAITAYTDGMPLNFRAANNSSGAVTINAGPGSISLSGSAGALQSGEIVTGGYYSAVYQVSTGTAVLVAQGAGAEQINPASQSKHAVQFGQLPGMIGSVRNASMSIAAASASGTFSADGIVVATALNGLQYLLPSFSKTINLATTGAGGMDTGTAPTSGFVALYAIYNPTTQTSALLATNAATLQPNVYGGANMPAGYTASALVSVWPTNGSKLFVVGYQNDRSIKMLAVTMLGTSTAAGSLTSLSIAGAVPLNAKTVSGTVGITFTITAGTQLSCALASSSAALGQQVVGVGGAASTVNTINGVFADLNLVTAQTVFYIFSFAGGTGQSLVVQANGYTF